MAMSFRTARNLSITIMMVLVFVLSLGSVFILQFIKYLYLETYKKIEIIERVTEIERQTKSAISQFESLVSFQPSDIKSIVAQFDTAIGLMDQCQKTLDSESERHAIERYRRHVNLFRVSLLSYAEEIRYDPIGSGAKELSRIVKTVKYETQEALVDLAANTYRDIEKAKIRIHEMLIIGRRLSFGVAAAGLGAGLLILFFLSRVLNQPIRRLVEATQMIMQGDLSHRIKMNNMDEIGQLADAFNQMTESLEKVQGRLILSEKMAALGQLSAGVAHEINNPISYVMSNFGALQEYFEALIALFNAVESEFINHPNGVGRFQQIADQYDWGYLKDDIPIVIRQSLEGTQRIQEIVAALKEYAHPGGGNGNSDHFLDVDINETIEKALSLVHNQIKYHCKLEKDFEHLPLISAKPNQLQQVFINILVNAAQAIEDKGIISIKTDIRDKWVTILFSDTGKGIPEYQIGKIFDPFFTTKPVGQGTGLGLAISYRIIEEHHGKIRVDSVVDQGTRFYIELPVHP